jgi:hypothetical protein
MEEPAAITKAPDRKTAMQKSTVICLLVAGLLRIRR